ncbi:penicillin-binding transpeptidase domain-containing protein [Corynebacterium sp. p3-SID1145]|uniref:penicillin-binding transpeptidase domain-containing protein n=1 Tax=unclassified Corynebacterium TaxID=2624378 RepID=UPI0021AAF806|nr:MULTISPECIES: penicillin-binding transpeptidase domain-containing protein [unclassified Corynebacterium]MCT1451386.1 penicillin-binding transpeptidase domain-containing protein [Corynebacterium sp. p3-SID1145]MCT1460606.1 penicillin-binding transpeptidase domain-containing protein [Corynebacterium sp. p3-SID1140]
MKTRVSVLLTVLAFVMGAAGCTPKPNPAEPVAQDFLEALSRFDYDQMAALVDDSAKASDSLSTSVAGLQAEGVTATLNSVDQQENLATANYTLDWALPRDRHVRYDASMTLTQQNQDWTVRWQPSILHPRLGANQHLELRTVPADQASVVSSDGVALLSPGVAYRLLVDTNAVGDKTNTAASISQALAAAHEQDPSVPLRDAGELEKQLADASGVFSVAMIPLGARDAVEGAVGGLKGVRLNEEASMVADEPHFAPDIMARIGEEVRTDLEGDAGWKVSIVNENANELEDIERHDATPSPSITVSLSHKVQTAAEKALEPINGQKAMIVAIRPSSGEILAVAQTKAADEDGNTAMMGQYPPGSTFKILTAYSGLEHQGLNPDSIVPCPGTMDIYGRTVTNYAGFGMGNVPLQTAFARSCNTTFADISTKLAPGELRDVGKQFGLGIDYKIAGLDSLTGSIPDGEEPLDRTEAGYGQGLDLASPFGMALVSATAANGSTPKPYLIAGRDTTPSEEAPQPDPRAIEQLRQMMKAVTSPGGTATGMGAGGDIRGKTGEAEINGGSHSWFTGYRDDDIAFATLIVLGGGSEAAVAVTDTMLRNIDEAGAPKPQ